MLRSYSICMILAMISISGCRSKSTSSYDREVDLTVRAAFDQITESERQQLFQENNPILLQIADPALKGLMRLFAELPKNQHAELRDKLFLKWRFADLDRSRQKAFEQVLEMNSKMLVDQAQIEQADRLMSLLAQCDVGFAVVEVPSSGEKVISCFVIWPNNLFPTWVTVSNAKASLTQEAMAAHMTRLPMLKLLSHSDLPPVGNADHVRPSETTVEKNGVGRFAPRVSRGWNDQNKQLRT